MSKRPDRAELESFTGSSLSNPRPAAAASTVVKPENSPARKRRSSGITTAIATGIGTATFPMSGSSTSAAAPMAAGIEQSMMSDLSMAPPPAKKSRTNTPWTPAEEQRLKTMKDAGNSWAEIAKTFPNRTEGSVKKHYYKDMHYAEFAEDESQALLNAIKDYETNKWKEIGKKVGKPAKACEQYAKEHFVGRM
ncbi:uncharacterized protein RAG0_17443 [Rhynchosporium agropyri]|uniref:Uncharacterized protein n=1 Tax=Rhynchosporium agropyri TaxID=914238 RepID=A0A1E1LTT4_9HELO|nr:uncharacterized protein RAG0_17443 [Rhynchosporium agropyri]